MISILPKMGRPFLGNAQKIEHQWFVNHVMIDCFFWEHELIHIGFSNRYQAVEELNVTNMNMS